MKNNFKNLILFEHLIKLFFVAYIFNSLCNLINEEVLIAFIFGLLLFCIGFYLKFLFEAEESQAEEFRSIVSHTALTLGSVVTRKFDKNLQEFKYRRSYHDELEFGEVLRIKMYCRVSDIERWDCRYMFYTQEYMDRWGISAKDY